MPREPVTTGRSPWAIRGIAVGAVLILAGYALAFGGASMVRVGALALAAGNAVLAPAAIALGIPRQGRWARPVRGVLWATGGVILAAIVLALLLPDSGAIVLGFPTRAAIVLYGAGVLPLLVLPVLFALSFDDAVFDDARVARLRALVPDESGQPAPEREA